MSFLQNIQLFDLKVYNQTVKEFLTGMVSFELFLNNRYCKRHLGLSHNDMVKNNWINENWIYFIKWYKGDWKRFFLYKGNYLFRGIRYYNISSIKNIIRYGNDRDKNDETLMVPKKIIEKYGTDTTKWIWATYYISTAWQAANEQLGRQNGVRAIVVYNADLLKREGNRYLDVFTLSPGVSSFKDALYGIIRVKYV